MSEAYKFWTDAISYQEFGTKSDKNYYITGYISTSDVDRHNEVVTQEAMKEMLTQLKSGNIKLDVEHDTFQGKANIPIGRILEARIDGKGLWIKAMLNKSHDKFDSVWKSIKDGFLDAFSIAYKVKDVVQETVNGAAVRMLKSLELLNVAITGVPVNTYATMQSSFLKSANAFVEATRPYEVEIKSEEEQTMVEEQVVEKPAEEPKEEVKEEAVAEPETTPEEPKEEVTKEEMNNVLDQIKSLTKEIVELKAENKKLHDTLVKPQLKAMVPKEEIKKEIPRLKSVLDAI